MASKKKKTDPNTLTVNRKARHDYHIEANFEAGLALEGWEVKSIRAGRAQISESYILIKDSEAYLFGATITPLKTTSTHKQVDPMRNRKCLLHRKELDTLIGSVERKGYTLVPLKLYWKSGKIKLAIGLAKGKKSHDKRATIKEREWSRDKQRSAKVAKNLN